MEGLSHLSDSHKNMTDMEVSSRDSQALGTRFSDFHHGRTENRGPRDWGQACRCFDILTLIIILLG